MRRTHRRSGREAWPRQRIRLLASLMLFAAGSAPLLFAQSWYNQAWTSRQQITISSNAYGLSADLSRFPFLVKITNPANDVFARAQASGNDILFTAGDGVTKIPLEIENYSNSTKDLTAWVQVPVFSHTAATVIYMYYGNPGAGSQQQPTQVWDSSFGAVYHLKETGGSGTYADSTGNANAGLGGRSPRTMRRRGRLPPQLPGTGNPLPPRTRTTSPWQGRWGGRRARR